MSSLIVKLALGVNGSNHYCTGCSWQPLMCLKIKFFLASSEFWRLLITFANSLEPDQDRQNVGHDLDPNRLTLLLCS